MKTFNIHTMFKGLLCAVLLTGAVACSDDHYDINDGGTFSATRTIWQNIQDEPQLSDLAALLQRVPVIKSVSDKNSAVLYSTLLDQPQSFTFWAPVNGTYDAQYYHDLLDQAETITDDSLRAVARFRVGYQFFMNHMARFNYEGNASEQEIFLLNSKRAYYNAGAAMFNNIPLLSGYENIPSSNGTLHLLDGFSPFLKNMRENITEDYDFISSVLYSNSRDQVDGKFVFDSNSTNEYYFQNNTLDLNRSIPGAMDNKGNMIYVDSVWNSSNTLLDATYARLAHEDSTYIALVPSTEEAWNTAVNKLLPLFRYGSLYWTKWSYLTGQYDNQRNNGFSMSQETIDSLAYDRAYHCLFRSMYITPSDMGFNTEEFIDSAQLINTFLHRDTVLTTTDQVLYHPNGTRFVEGADPNALPENPIFSGLEPRRLSNGYVYELADGNLDPAYLWLPKINFSPYYRNNVLMAKGCVNYENPTESAYSRGESVYLSESDRNEAINTDLLDHYDNSYQRFTSNGGQMQIFIALPNVLATSYRLKLVMAPNYTRLSDAKFKQVPVVDEDTGIPLVDEETGDAIVVEEMETVISKFTADVFYDSHNVNQTNDPGNRVNSATVTIEVDQDAVKEYVIFDKLTFNKSYYQLPSDDGSNPYLVITVSARNLQNNNNALNIVRVILEPLLEGE